MKHHDRISQGTRALLLALSLPVSTAAFAQGKSQQAPGWQNTHDPVFSSATAQYQGLASQSQPVTITVMLKLNNKDVLDSYVKAQHTPGDPLYQKWLSSDQVIQNFAPTDAQAQAVADYLYANGFTNIQIADNNVVVTATGTVASAQRAFNTQVGAFKRNGNNGIGNLNAIQIPVALSQIDYVLGLDTVHKMHTHGMRVAQAAVTSGATCYPSGSTPPLCSSTGNTAGYFPDQFSTVYNRPSGNTGRNTTVAIVGWGNMTNAVNDLAQFEASQGIAAVPTSVMYFPAGTSTTDDTEQVEWAMDSQAIVGISGGVKQLTFYADTTGGTYSGLAAAINQAVSNNTAKVINMSWGLGECVSSSWYALDTVFQLGVSQGQTFAASTGDSGSTASGCTTTSAQYPASSPYVIAIGGTTLTTATNAVYQSEAAWSGSGGGISGKEAKPSWQSSLSGSYRQIPDLAFDGDPNTGAWLWLTASTSSGITANGWRGMYAGTSLSSPLFVGAWAVVESAKNNALGFVPPLIYPNAAQWQSSSVLHDVTSGSNGAYSAKAGYDNVTGWGSFNIANILTKF